MTPTEFLERVVPNGLIVVASLKNRIFDHHVFDNIAVAAQQAQTIDRLHTDCYFGLGSLKERQVWNPNWKDKSGTVAGKWEVRVGSNIAALKCLFLDMDVDPANPAKYASQELALEALDRVLYETNILDPLVVNSGGGLHCYWPFSSSIPVADWLPVATAFKRALQQRGFKFDPSRTADISSVLRVPGTHNYKSSTPRLVEVLRDAGPYTPKEIFACVQNLADLTGIVVAPEAAVPATALALLPNNLATEHPPAKFGPIIRGCRQILLSANTGGEVEPIWLASLSVTRCCEDSDRASLFVSNKYPNFSREEMDKRLQNLAARSIGPMNCTSFDQRLPGVCPTCSNFGKIENPIKLGYQRNLPATGPLPVATITTPSGSTVTYAMPDLPHPYVRGATGGVLMDMPPKAGVEVAPQLLYDHDMYPIRRSVNERHEAEETVWCVNLPREGWRELTIPQTSLADPKRTHALLLAKGVYIHPARIVPMVIFMVAYISKLQKDVETEQLYSRLGWRSKNEMFVLDDTVYHHDGSSSSHQVSTDMRSELPGLGRAGTLQGWKDAIQFYNAPEHEAYRFFLYGAFSAPLFHMTGLKGAIVNATGPTGIGKTTVLQAVGSVWGHPQNMMASGTKSGSTVTALYSMLSAHNNIPFCLDEITTIDRKVLGEFVMQVPQGQGKRRSTRSGFLSKHVETWATEVLTSANTDVYMSLMQNRRDASAEAMRVLQIPFSKPSTYNKAQADEYCKRQMMAHYGHAAHEFVPYVVGHYAQIKETMDRVVQIVDARARVTSEERFYSGVIGAHIVGAMVARKCGLLDDFPIDHDLDWAVEQISVLRTTMQDHIAVPKEIISEFLEARVSETLAISQTLQANIAPRIDLTPRGALSIRHEVDTDMVYLLKAEFKRYCLETGANYGAIQDALIADNVLLDHDARKVLGAGTDFGKGQVRCWLLNMKELRK